MEDKSIAMLVDECVEAQADRIVVINLHFDYGHACAHCNYSPSVTMTDEVAKALALYTLHNDAQIGIPEHLITWVEWRFE